MSSEPGALPQVIRFSCAAILFDLDGVLVDSTRSVDRQYRLWAKENGLDGDYLMAIAHGVRTSEVVKRVAPHLDAAAETIKIEMREAADRAGAMVMPGAVRLVSSIPAGRWCVVTSGTRMLASTRLRDAGIPIPGVFVTAESVSRGKPYPEPYLRGAELLGVNPAECLVLEDAPAGIASAHAAGMKVAGLLSTYAAEALMEADLIMASLDSIKVTPAGEANRLDLEIQPVR